MYFFLIRSLPFFHSPFPIALPSSIGIHSNIFNVVPPIHLMDPYLDIWAPLQKYKADVCGCVTHKWNCAINLILFLLSSLISAFEVNSGCFYTNLFHYPVVCILHVLFVHSLEMDTSAAPSSAAINFLRHFSLCSLKNFPGCMLVCPGTSLLDFKVLGCPSEWLYQQWVKALFSHLLTNAW